MSDDALHPPVRPAPRKPTVRFLFSHPAHFIALGFGSGLSPVAPGTVGTLWAWLVFLLLQPLLSPLRWGLVIVVALVVGWWACTVAARHLAVADPGAIVWDEVVAFWIVLWLVMPASGWTQLAAFALFRAFDAAKPGPVAWADQLFKGKRNQPIGWRQGLGILFDDLVAALCALILIALWRWW
ncbi:MAG TPA: phosphatidylglycerophosphatase A [Albitalea sp.]|uniref:phosphatidylglycerophosphatase A family protein n=1 Tax=Piscinibacter sp. TaxID=1903157 RepID=UPI002ED2A42F